VKARIIVIGSFLVLVAIVVGVLRVVGARQSATQAAVATAAPTLAESAASGSPLPAEASGSPASSPLGSASPGDSASPADATASSAAPTSGASGAPGQPSAAPTAVPSIPTPPPGLAPGWEKETERVENGREADLLVRTGAIDNLGYGWPPNFTPFSGKSTPVHQWLCTSRPGAAPGTDRSMLGTGVNPSAGRSGDGYSGCSKRPDNLPQAVPLEIGTLPSTIHGVFFQMFLDDFQAPTFHSHFQVSLNGTRIPQFEDTINQMDQTGPVGKLLTLQLLPEYWPLLKSGTVNFLIDDPTTGAMDGYAIGFVRVLVNPKPFQYAVSISCTVVDADTQKPIAKASVSAAQVTTATGADGTCSMRGAPAGLVSVAASAVGYDSQTQLLDLAAGDHGDAHFALHPHKESVADLRAQIQKSGTVAIYGIHFDTASSTLRPDSAKSLDEILQLIRGIPGSRWTIAGHTDNQGGAAYNLGLSLSRANSRSTASVRIA
jgi:outer membrane protein OmpA-like peptidoglycan-associated protein